MSNLEISLRSSGNGLPSHHVRGDLDAASAPRLVRHIEEFIASAELEPVRLDLAEVDFIDSTGVGALVKARSLLNESGSELTIIACSPAVTRVLALVGLTGAFLSE